MDRVLELLERRRWDKRCRRTNIATPEQIVGTTFRTALLESNKIRPSEHELRDAIQAIAPDWEYEYDIVLNRNAQCQRHRDSGNVGRSWMLWLGDFEGGALCFEDGHRITLKEVWHNFDGRQYHWNEPHTGTKYSIILYRAGRESCGSQIAKRRHGLGSLRVRDAEGEGHRE